MFRISVSTCHDERHERTLTSAFYAYDSTPMRAPDLLLPSFDLVHNTLSMHSLIYHATYVGLRLYVTQGLFLVRSFQITRVSP
jgi:hypothetical protein